MGSHPKALNFTFEFRFAIEQSKQNPFGSVSSKLSVIIIVEDSMSKLCRYVIWLTFYNIDRCVCLKKNIFLSNVYTDFDDFYKFWIFFWILIIKQTLFYETYHNAKNRVSILFYYSKIYLLRNQKSFKKYNWYFTLTIETLKYSIYKSFTDFNTATWRMYNKMLVSKTKMLLYFSDWCLP